MEITPPSTSPTFVRLRAAGPNEPHSPASRRRSGGFGSGFGSGSGSSSPASSPPRARPFGKGRFRRPAPSSPPPGPECWTPYGATPRRYVQYAGSGEPDDGSLSEDVADAADAADAPFRLWQMRGALPFVGHVPRSRRPPSSPLVTAANVWWNTQTTAAEREEWRHQSSDSEPDDDARERPSAGPALLGNPPRPRHEHRAHVAAPDGQPRADGRPHVAGPGRHGGGATDDSGPGRALVDEYRALKETAAVQRHEQLHTRGAADADREGHARLEHRAVIVDAWTKSSGVGELNSLLRDGWAVGSSTASPTGDGWLLILNRPKTCRGAGRVHEEAQLQETPATQPDAPPAVHPLPFDAASIAEGAHDRSEFFRMANSLLATREGVSAAEDAEYMYSDRQLSDLRAAGEEETDYSVRQLSDLRAAGV